MTITTNDVRDEYTASAAQTVFNYTFKIFADGQLNVYITPSGQEPNDSTDITTAYTIDPSSIGDEDGGFITLDSGTSNGDLVTIVSNIPEARTTDYQNSGDFLPDTVNADFDTVVSLVKQVEDKSNRTLAFQNSLQNATALTLPAPSAGLFMVWNGSETGLENTGVPSVIVPGDLSGTLTALKSATNLTIGDFVVTTGYNANGDSGDNTYEIVAAATGTDDGGSFIDLAGSGLQAKGLFPRGVRSVKQWGAVGDGVTDDTAATQAAIDASAHVTAYGGPYRLTDELATTRSVIIECDRYDYSLSAADCTFLCDFNDTAKSVFLAENSFQLILRDISIDMDQNATRAVTATSSGIVSTKNILITRFDATSPTACVALESGANHFESFLIDAEPVTILDGTGITTGSIGIHVTGSDNVVSDGEIKKGFDNGVLEDGSNNLITLNKLDQCNTGGKFIGTNPQIIGNRFGKNYNVNSAGLHLGDNAGADSVINPTVIGNTCSKNNSTTALGPGSYDGTQILCDRVDAGVISGNPISEGLSGIKLNRVNDTTIGVNSYTTIDGDEIALTGDAPGGGRSQLYLPRGHQVISPKSVPANGWDIEGEYALAGASASLRVDDVTRISADNDATAGNTSMLLYDVDNATLERVTVGVADSGGVGFKVLRIPN